jgi:hypothetical protein
MSLTRLIAALAFVLPSSASASAAEPDPPLAGHPDGHPSGAGGHFADGHAAWSAHPGWHASIQHFDAYWHGGHWWHGTYGGRSGWWWIVGPDWYWYPTAVYPWPDPYTPPEMAGGYWYWCDAYQEYYPYAGACPSVGEPCRRNIPTSPEQIHDDAT